MTARGVGSGALKRYTAEGEGELGDQGQVHLKLALESAQVCAMLVISCPVCEMLSEPDDYFPFREVRKRNM